MAASRLSRLSLLSPSSHSLDHFASNLRAGDSSVPLLLRGLLSSSSSPEVPGEVPGLEPTPALHWNADGQMGGILKAKEKEVRVEMAREGRGYVGKREGAWAEGRMRLELFHAAFLARSIPSSSSVPMVGYVAQQPLSELPELEADVPMLPHLQYASQDWGRMLWLGGAGTFTPLHRDPHHNLFSQLVGRKRVHLFPPSCAPHLHLHPGGPLQNTSQIGDEAPFLQPPTPPPSSSSDGEAEAEEWEIEEALKHPLATHVTLEPADVLFIPKRWLHCVAGLDDSASVNAWFH